MVTSEAKVYQERIKGKSIEHQTDAFGQFVTREAIR